VSAIEGSNSASPGRRPAADSKAASAKARSLLLPVAIGLIVVASVGLLAWSKRTQKNAGQTVAPAIYPAHRSTSLLEAVKEELFQLEKDKVRGSISREEYATAKQALEQSVQRAMAKAAAQKS